MIDCESSASFGIWICVPSSSDLKVVTEKVDAAHSQYIWPGDELRAYRGRAQGRGTIAYVAPEIVLEGKAGFSADVYAFGVVVW